MTDVVPATPDMFDSVHTLLTDFDAPKMTKADWHRMLVGHGWAPKGAPFGYVLRDDAQTPVGFIGTVHSAQVLAGQRERLCNLSSWIVQPKYRLHGLKLVRAALADKGVTYTALTLIEASRKVFTRFGFKTLEEAALVLTPLSPFATRAGYRGLWSSVRAFRDPSAIRERLRGASKLVFEAHAEALCEHLLLEGPAPKECALGQPEQLYMVLTPWTLKRQKARHVHHVSDSSLFWRWQRQVQWAVFRGTGAMFVMVDERQARPGLVRPRRGVMRMPLRQPRLFRPAHENVDPATVGALFSELMYLKT